MQLQCDEKRKKAEKQWTKESDTGLSVFKEGVMYERFGAISTVRLHGCVVAFLSRDLISVSRRGGNRW